MATPKFIEGAIGHWSRYCASLLHHFRSRQALITAVIDDVLRELEREE